MVQGAETSPVKRITAIYPGSFDPLTNGHLDLISRGSVLADRFIVAVLNNSQKQPLFTIAERVSMIREAVAGMSGVEVDSFEGLLAEYAAQQGAQVILRGVRAMADYEAERQMALINRRLRPGLETVFLIAREEFSYLSSRMIKEIFSLGGDVRSFVPPGVAERLRHKLRP